MASSYVNSLRVRISDVGREKLNTLNLNAITMFDPIDVTCFVMFAFSPFTIDEIAMTVLTPITMPSTVSADLNLFLRMVSIAMLKLSL
jgi:hypothetical protein